MFSDDATKSWQAGDRIKILNLASEFLEQIASLQAQVSSRSLAEPLEAQVVQSAIYRGTQFLYDKGCTGNGCLNRDLWFKDTPVPAATRRVLKEAIRPAFGDAGIQIEKGMRAWAGQLNPNQQYVLRLVDAMGPAALALVGETDALASALYKSLQATAADLAVAVRDTVLTSASFTPGLGDANDLCEVTTAREFCGASGRSLSFSERALSAAGFLIGTGQAWRSVGSKLKAFFVGTERTAIVEAGMKFVDAAGKLGISKADEAKAVFVDLASATRRNHILYGDATGGGHMFPGKPGKSVFPQSWDGDKIMNEVSDIVTDPRVNWEPNRTVRGFERFKARATRDGVEIEVIIEPKGDQIISAFPVSGPGVIRNP